MGKVKENTREARLSKENGRKVNLSKVNLRTMMEPLMKETGSEDGHTGMASKLFQTGNVMKVNFHWDGLGAKVAKSLVINERMAIGTKQSLSKVRLHLKC